MNTTVIRLQSLLVALFIKPNFIKPNLKEKEMPGSRSGDIYLVMMSINCQRRCQKPPPGQSCSKQNTINTSGHFTKENIYMYI